MLISRSTCLIVDIIACKYQKENMQIIDKYNLLKAMSKKGAYH
jgi:hypothetical protein